MISNSAGVRTHEHLSLMRMSPEPQCTAELRDPADVAPLIAILDRTRDTTEPGWEEVCESIVETIAKTGDARCLPALGRVRLARGSRFKCAVDSAIAALVLKQTGNSGG